MRSCSVICRAFVLVAVAASGCRGREYTETNGELSGRVVKGPVHGARVTVAKAVTGQVLAETTTGEDGAFRLELPGWYGDFLVCASGGAYSDEMTGVAVDASGHRLCAPVFDFAAGEVRAGVTITPWSNLVVSRAVALLRFRGKALVEGMPQAIEEVGAFLGCAGLGASVLRVDPSDPIAEGDAVGSLSPPLVAGLLLAGLSGQAALISERLELSAGVTVTGLQLASAYADDMEADGYFDGRGVAGLLDVAGYSLDSDSLRASQEGLAQGVRAFLLSPSNRSGATVADAQALLECLASARGPLWRDESSGGLDLDGPTIVINTPIDGASLSGAVMVQVAARDQSDVEDLWIEAGPGVTPGSPVIIGSAAELAAQLETAALADGPYLIVAHARDVLGNESETMRAVDINNNAPIITFDAPTVGEIVAGEVSVTVHAADPQGIVRLVIRNPAALADNDAASESFAGTWDSTLHLDGTFPLTAEAEDSEGNVSTASIAVQVGNTLAGSVAGVAALDSPVDGVRFQVYALGRGGRGAVLSANTMPASDGTFDLEVTDEYAGPLLIRAYGAGATFTSAATGEEVTFTAQDELLLALDYLPSAGGNHLEGLALSGLSTLAARLAERDIASGADASVAVERANRLFAEHLRRPDSFALATTTPSTFLVDPIADSDASQRVGVFHLGLSRLGAEIATEASLPRNAITSLDLLALLARDLENGVLDGLDGAGTAVVIYGPRTLVTNTLRSHLALSALRWLDDAPLADGTPGQNDTSLAPGNFAQTDGMLDLMSRNTSELFGPEPPEAFDIFGPAIVVAQPMADAKLRGAVTVSATASDPAGVLAVVGYIDGTASAALSADQLPAVEAFQATLTTTALANGPHVVRIVAKDNNDNVSIVDRRVVVDNLAPTLSAPTSLLVNTGSATINGAASDAHTGVASLDFFVGTNATPAETIEEPGASYSQAVAVPCNAVSTVRVVATDGAGLVTEKSVTVSCDDRAPAVSLGASTYRRASDYVVTWNNGFDYSPEVATQEVALHLLDWSSESSPVGIEHFFNRFDLLPVVGATIATQGLPSLRLEPNDFAQGGTVVGTTSGQLTVEYQYHHQGALVRDWTSVNGTAGAFTLPFAYQTLGTQLADATGSALHLVRVRARDAAGNIATRDFYFTVTAVSPPAFVTDCDFGQLPNANGLEFDSLEDWFEEHQYPNFRRMTLRLPLTPASSLAPWSYEVAMSNASVTFEETERGQSEKVLSAVPGCPSGSVLGSSMWCASLAVSSNYVGIGASCWPTIDNTILHLWQFDGFNTNCDSDEWLYPPSPAPNVAFHQSTIYGTGAIRETLPAQAWTFDASSSRWVMPAGHLSQGGLLFLDTRATDQHPVLPWAPSGGNAIALANHVEKFGGGQGYFVRENWGYEYTRQYNPGAGENGHWARKFESYEYITGLEATVDVQLPGVFVRGIGPVAVEVGDDAALPAAPPTCAVLTTSWTEN